MEWRGCSLEEVSRCPLCGDEGREEVYNFPPFKVMRCHRCSAAYLSPRLREEDMVGFYQDPSYYSSSSSPLGYSDYSAQAKGLEKSFRVLAKKLKNMGVTGGSLLEIGCGPGILLKAVGDLFSHKMGMDFSRSALEKAKAYAHEVVVGGIEVLPKTRRFDTVVGVSLIEHVYEPIAFMRSVVSHVEEDGAIVMVTPDFDGIWRKVLGERWPSFKVPEHVIFYNRNSLRLLGEVCGLTSSFFYFTQFALLSLVLNSLGMDGLLKALDGLQGLSLPLPHTMLGVVFKRQGHGS